MEQVAAIRIMKNVIELKELRSGKRFPTPPLREEFHDREFHEEEENPMKIITRVKKKKKKRMKDAKKRWTYKKSNGTGNF